MSIESESFEVTRGNTWERELEFTVNNVAKPIVGWVVLFTVKSKISDLDDSAIISKTLKDADFTDPLNGKTDLKLTTTDTNVTPGSYIYDIKIITASESELTIINGSFTILSGVTLRDA